MFEEERKEIDSIVDKCKKSLIEISVGVLKFSDVVIQHSKNTAGHTITVKGTVLFKFLIGESIFCGATIDYTRNLKGSRKEYVTLKIEYSVNNIQFNDTIDFVDGHDSDKFNSSNLYSSKCIFNAVEDLIQPLLRNNALSLSDF